MTEIVGLKLIARLDDEAVELVWHHSDGGTISVRLNGRGIFDLREEIDALLRQVPEIHQWKTKARLQ